MRNLVASLAVILAFVSAFSVVYIRYHVGEEIEAINALSRQIKKDKKAIHVLKTELAYLTSPSQLQELSVSYLAMMPPRSDQILVSLSAVPLRRDISQRIVAFDEGGASDRAIKLAQQQDESKSALIEGRRP